MPRGWAHRARGTTDRCGRRCAQRRVASRGGGNRNVEDRDSRSARAQAYPLRRPLIPLRLSVVERRSGGGVLECLDELAQAVLVVEVDLERRLARTRASTPGEPAHRVDGRGRRGPDRPAASGVAASASRRPSALPARRRERTGRRERSGGRGAGGLPGPARPARHGRAPRSARRARPCPARRRAARACAAGWRQTASNVRRAPRRPRATARTRRRAPRTRAPPRPARAARGRRSRPARGAASRGRRPAARPPAPWPHPPRAQPASAARRRSAPSRPPHAAGRAPAGRRPAPGSTRRGRRSPRCRNGGAAVAGWDGSSRPAAARAPRCDAPPRSTSRPRPRPRRDAGAAQAALDKLHRHLPVRLRSGGASGRTRSPAGRGSAPPPGAPIVEPSSRRRGRRGAAEPLLHLRRQLRPPVDHRQQHACEREAAG